jgi:uncharacterized membrane protein
MWKTGLVFLVLFGIMIAEPPPPPATEEEPAEAEMTVEEAMEEIRADQDVERDDQIDIEELDPDLLEELGNALVRENLAGTGLQGLVDKLINSITGASVSESRIKMAKAYLSAKALNVTGSVPAGAVQRGIKGALGSVPGSSIGTALEGENAPQNAASGARRTAGRVGVGTGTGGLGDLLTTILGGVGSLRYLVLLVPLIILGAITFAILGARRRSKQRPRPVAPTTFIQAPESAMEALRKRYVNDEITKEDFEVKREAIENPGPSPTDDLGPSPTDYLDEKPVDD